MYRPTKYFPNSLIFTLFYLGCKAATSYHLQIGNSFDLKTYLFFILRLEMFNSLLAKMWIFIRLSSKVARYSSKDFELNLVLPSKYICSTAQPIEPLPGFCYSFLFLSSVHLFFLLLDLDFNIKSIVRLIFFDWVSNLSSNLKQCLQSRAPGRIEKVLALPWIVQLDT